MRLSTGKLSARVLLPGVLLLVACQPNTLESGWRDYLARIANALRHELPVVEMPPPVAMPRLRELHTTRESSQRSSIGILEFLALDDCKLKQLIAARNSPLGKLAPGSQQLVYELGFLQHAPACIAVLRREARNELAAELATEFAQKQASLPLHIWRATLGGREFRELWQVPAAALNRRYYSLHETIMALESLLAAGENATYKNWREQRNLDMQTWLGAPRRHIETIRFFYHRCGITNLGSV